jgi:replicative DNA helicase
MSEDDLDKIQSAATRLKPARLLIDESSTLTPAQMAARARQVKRRHGLDLVVIDYLQLMVGDGASRNEEVSQISRAMKLMARELDVPVVLLSQLSRKPEERPDKRPVLSDLRDSGSIEQDADVVLMLYRDDYYHPETPHRGVTEALIRKNRQGPTGMVPLVFMAEYSRFGDADASVREMLREAREERKPARRKSWPQSVPL